MTYMYKYSHSGKVAIVEEKKRIITFLYYNLKVFRVNTAICVLLIITSLFFGSFGYECGFSIFFFLSCLLP